MKKSNEWIEKYKKISILALFGIIFGVLCLSVCIVGFSYHGTHNVAYAKGTDDEGTIVVKNLIYYGEFSVLDNITYGLLPNAIDITPLTLNFNKLYTSSNDNISFVDHQLIIDSSSSDTTIYFSCPYRTVNTAYQFAFEVDNTNSSSGYLFQVFRSYVSGGLITINNIAQSTFVNKYYYFTQSFGSGYTSNCCFYGLTVPSGVKLVLNRCYLYEIPVNLYTYLGNYFMGFLSNDWHPNGYDDGYNNGLTVGTSRGYDEGYEQGRSVGSTLGYDEGYSLGKEEGQSIGYSIGYSDGSSVAEEVQQYYYDTGYDTGYLQGAYDSSDYSFISLFGAIFDVPVQTFNGLLDIDILGINMRGLYIGLISLAVALFILKIIFR